MKAVFSICVHGQMLPAFIENNTDALTALASHIPVELVVYGEHCMLQGIPVPCNFVSVEGAKYNQALLALIRHATGEYVMLADASDHIHADALIPAILQLGKSSDVIAVAGGITAIDVDFMEHLSPAGILIRRSAACRFLRVTEYGLLSGWFTLAQLAQSGKVITENTALSTRKRIHPPYFKPFNLLNRISDNTRPERYSGFLYLYDHITIDRYLTDSEQFLLFWPGYKNKNAAWRTVRMFEKRSRLYGIAAEQAHGDGRAAIALHFSARSQLAGPSQKVNGKRSNLYQKIRNLFSEPANITHKSFAVDIDKAIAEQLVLFHSIMGKDTCIVLEDCTQLRALKPHLAHMAAEFVSKRELLDKISSPDEFVILYDELSIRERLQRNPGASPGRQLSYEQLKQFVAGAVVPVGEEVFA